jgi:co-chaperonin GroES (HSP10)|tara:strand:- start:790 stop:1254 length:465 start_codon:yes stop_codon:yes gene_type:complete
MDIKTAQTKGFGSDGGKQYTVENDIIPLKKRVLVSDMHFGETKSKGGIILVDDDGTAQGIHPRWGKVYAVGRLQDDVKVGQWIMVAHGRWSRAFKVKRKEQGSAGEIGVELEVRMIDENDILLVSDTEPEFNRHQAGYVNTGGMQQMTSLPGND